MTASSHGGGITCITSAAYVPSAHARAAFTCERCAIGVLLLAADAVLLGHLLGGLAHELAGRRLAREAGHRRDQVLGDELRERLRAWPQASFAFCAAISASRSGLRHAERHVAHAVRAAGDRDVVLAGEDGLGRVGHRLDRRRARARHAERVDVLRQPRPEHDLARDVQPVERRHDLSVDAERDVLGVRSRRARRAPSRPRCRGRRSSCGEARSPLW